MNRTKNPFKRLMARVVWFVGTHIDDVCENHRWLYTNPLTKGVAMWGYSWEANMNAWTYVGWLRSRRLSNRSERLLNAGFRKVHESGSKGFVREWGLNQLIRSRDLREKAHAEHGKGYLS